MAYQRQTWVDYPDRSTPITAERLNHMEAGIEEGNVVRYSNPNLLDNPFFTVNQRQGFMTKDANVVYYSDAALTQPQHAIGWIATSSANKLHKVSATAWAFGDNGEFYVKASDVVSGYVGAGYTLDRWYSNGYNSGNVKIYSDGVELPAYLGMVQRSDSQPFGKVCTFSVMESNGSIASVTFNYPTESESFRQYVLKDWAVQAGGVINGIVFFLNVNSTKRIKAVKLELGSVSTLANDVAPNYAEELAKCQRYFQRITPLTALTSIGNGICPVATLGRIILNLPTTMRTGGSVTTHGEWVLYNGTEKSITSISKHSQTLDKVVIDCTSSGLTAGSATQLRNKTANAYIDISADL